MNAGKLWLLMVVFTILAAIFTFKIVQNISLDEPSHISISEFRDLQDTVKELQLQVVNFQTMTNWCHDPSYVMATNEMGWRIEQLKWEWVHGETNEWGWGDGYGWRYR